MRIYSDQKRIESESVHETRVRIPVKFPQAFLRHFLLHFPLITSSPPNLSERSSKPSLNSVYNSPMAHRQLTDSLTSHISLYHSHSLPPNSNPNPRSSILKWFSSLSLHQRQAHLTILDPKFVQILIQMLGKVRTHGHGSFIILPDLPSSHDLPSLCFKKSRGLLSRVAESNESERWIIQSTRLFGSREGENVNSCSCSVKNLDTVTVTEGFVESMDRFVEAMDNVSNGAFLRGEESELGLDWVELGWLKSKGYYGMASFLANRLEVAMRLAWMMNCNGGKKRGVKLKEKLSGVGVATNVYWRKKGCVDWWRNLDAAMRKKVLTTIIGKAAKTLVLFWCFKIQIMKNAISVIYCIDLML